MCLSLLPRREPAHFPAILGFMRDGQAAVPSDPAAQAGLRAEAAYFGCWPLVEALDAAQERHARAEVGDRRQQGEMGAGSCRWVLVGCRHRLHPPACDC